MQNTKVNPELDPWAARVASWVNDAGILNEDIEENVRSAFSRVPRAHFVEAEYEAQSYEDVDLPLAHGQWLTRPSILIRMMGLINLQKRMRILELGFGSGYLCAVMAAAGAQVFGLETVGTFAQSSRKHLDALGHHGVVVRRGDGKKGWPEVAPFDAIVVSYPLVNDLELPLSQLSINGILIAPVVSEHGARLTVWKRTPESYKRIVFEEVQFL
jgi:protein-L-isoaspartate(D-aspartate) O-methyltransferase